MKSPDTHGARQFLIGHVSSRNVTEAEHEIAPWSPLNEAGAVRAALKRFKMMDSERIRGKAKICRRLASLADDIEIERRLTALANVYEAKAVQAEAQAACYKK